MKLTTHAQLIFVFMDPIGQAFSEPLREFVQKAQGQCGSRMHFFLTKADTIDEEERTRIVSSISQTLSVKISQRTLDVRPFSLPRESEERKSSTEEDDHANSLRYICELIETAVNNTVQSNGSQLSQDLAKVTRAAQLALKSVSARKRWFKWMTIFGILIESYFIMAITSHRVYYFGGLHYLAGIILVIWMIALCLKPTSREIIRLEAFVNRTARTGQAKVEEYFRQLTTDDDNE
jgi:hypothetical protein